MSLKPDIPHMIGNQYDILRTIFSHLTVNELKKVSLVCRLWAETAATTLRDSERRNITTFHWLGDNRSLTWYKDFPVLESPNHKHLEEDVRKFIDGLKFEPKVAVVLNVGDVEFSCNDKKDINDPNDNQSVVRPSFIVNMNKMREMFPKECTTVSLSATGIVGMNTPSTAIETENIWPFRRGIQPAVSALLLPDFPGTNIVPFYLKESPKYFTDMFNELKSECPDNDMVKMNEAFLKKATGLSAKDKIKCVIVLTTGTESPCAMQLLQAASQVTERQLAIGGGIGDMIWSSTSSRDVIDIVHSFMLTQSTNCNEYSCSTGLVFAGEGVEAASVVLGQNVRSEKRVEQELSRLKKANMDEKHSCGFMFACCGRGRAFYKQRSNVESGIFRKLFPQTPLIGFFGGGEIGTDFVPGEDQTKNTFSSPGAEEKAKLKQNEPLNIEDISFGYTTVFVLVTFTQKAEKNNK